jgi:hypothetical protein
MNNYLSILNKANVDIDIDANVKFFLIKLLQKFQLKDEIKVPVKTLQNEFGVTDRVITKSFKALTDAKVLTQKNKYGGKGRPCNSYLFTELFRNKITEVDVPHQSIIEELLVSDSIKKAKCNELSLKKHPLGLSTRIVLIVMLYYADDNGVLSTLGVTELSKISGLTFSATRVNIAKLKKQQYIRCSVGGVSSSLLFNQANSHYHLNISPSIFSSAQKSTVISLQTNFSSGAFGIFEYARQIITDKKMRKRTDMLTTPQMEKAWPEDKFSEIAMFFNESKSLRIADFLQLKMEFYASMLLSNYWDDLACKEGESALIISINKDIYKSAVLVEVNNQVEELFCMFIYDTALLIAQKSKKGIVAAINNNSLSLNKMKHVIIPQLNYSGRFLNSVIESFYDGDIGGDISPFYIFKSVNGGGFTAKIDVLDDIALSKLNLLSEQ